MSHQVPHKEVPVDTPKEEISTDMPAQPVQESGGFFSSVASWFSGEDSASHHTPTKTASSHSSSYETNTSSYESNSSSYESDNSSFWGGSGSSDSGSSDY